MQLIRNAVDHGIEAPDQRVAGGKPEVGTVRIDACLADTSLVVTVADDGRGIDAATVREAAVRRGVLTSEEVRALTDAGPALALVFAPGVTTVGVPTQLSGRGVGLDIVRTRIEGLGGTVEVDSAEGLGTSFTLRASPTPGIGRRRRDGLDGTTGEGSSRAPARTRRWRRYSSPTTRRSCG